MTTHKAKQTPQDLPGSGWYEILPTPSFERVLEAEIRADWIIVGSGFAGLSAAKRLDQLVKGQRIIILDAQRVGFGAAGRNSGFMIDLPHDLQSEDYASSLEEDKKQIWMNRTAIEFAGRNVSEYGLEENWKPGGKINAATDGAGMAALRSYSKHLENLGEPFRFQSGKELEEITGINYYSGALHTPGCVQIQPAGYIRGLAEGLIKSSHNTIEIYENSPVMEITSGDKTEIRTPKGKVSGGKIIMTTNGHLASFGFYQKQLMHVFTYASMTRKLDLAEVNALGGETEWGVIPAHPMGSTVRRIKQDRIVVRNTFTYNPKLKTTQSQVDRLGKKHDKSFIKRFPMLDKVSMEYRWGGHLCLSLNSTPVFGELEKNLYAACCQNGLGTVKGTLGGMLIAELATEQNNPMVDEMQAYDAPKKLYPEPFMSLGAHAKMWWIHKHAGKDL